MLDIINQDDINEVQKFLKKKSKFSSLKYYYLKKLMYYGHSCEFIKTNLLKTYQTSIKQIINQYFIIIQNTNKEDEDIDNLILTTCVINKFVKYLDTLKERIKTIQNEEMLSEAHNLIIFKIKKVLEVIRNSLQNKLTVEDINNIITKG